MARGEDFVFKDLNQAAREIEDITLEEAVGRRLTEVFPGAAGEFGILEALRRVNRTGKSEILPAREYRDDRVAGWRQNRLFKLASGEVASSYVDMTRHVEMEQQLRKEKRFVEVIAETSPVGITRLDGAGQIVFANRRAGEILGWTPEEICRLGFSSGEWRITDEQGEALAADQLPFAVVRRTGEPVFDFRHRIQGAGGEDRLLSINAAPVFTEEGEFDGMVSALDDITGEMAEEARRERLVQELASAQERLQALFDQAGDAIYITDLQGRFIQANREAARMSGYSREELLTLGVGDVEAETDTPEKIEELISSLRGKPPLLLSSRHRRKDGTVFPVELTIAVAELPGGPEVVAYVRDITERKRNEAALQRAAEEREHLLGELQHRAKNSFSMISSMVQLMHRSRKNPETREVLEELRGRISAFSELYDLLYQTRDVVRVSLDAYLDRVIRSMGQQAPGVQVTRELEEISLSARRAVFLGLITSELVNNALKHAYGEDGTGTLGVFLRKEGEQGVLSVADDGDGSDRMSARASGTASGPGSGPGSGGMGLSLVRSLAESLEGTFSVDRGEGTVCRVVFPLYEPEE